MKFMKLGTRPDTFFTSESVRSISTEVATDLQIQAQSCLYHLHKFPLLSKCLLLQSLCAESGGGGVIELPAFPGGAEAFETCAKFCYGITITVSALNLVPVRCAAAHLGMTEDADRGNLAAKLDAFLASCVLPRWKDALVVLHCTRQYAPLCEELGITSRCVDAVATLITGQSNPGKPTLSAKSWWAQDIAELGIDIYWRIMVAVKATGTVRDKTVGDALKAYARRWLPNIAKDGHRMEQSVDTGGAESIKQITVKHRLLLEKIVSLLPAEKNAVSCSFLLKLLKAANILSASPASKMELARRVGLQLEEANVSDLLIPSLSCMSETLYDVDIVMAILEEFMLQQAAHSPPASPRRRDVSLHERRRHRRSRSAENVEFEAQEGARRSSSCSAASHGARLRVAKLVDGYLMEVAKDVNLPLDKLIAIAEAVPDIARPEHDDLYRVVDTYLRAHPDMGKSARKRLCRILNCRKLSEQACMHAAQNELLPLRVVVQVLFFEHARAAALSGNNIPDLPNGIKALLAKSGSEDDEEKDNQRLRSLAGVTPDDDWSVEGLKRAASRIATLRMKLEEDENDADDEEFVHRHGGGLTRSASSRFRAFCAIPGKPKRMLSKLWPLSRGITDRH